MRLIDADAFFNEFPELRDYEYASQEYEIDAIPMVRCKDCKHMVEHKGYGYLGESAYTCESNMGGWVLLDSYCSRAERKEE